MYVQITDHCNMSCAHCGFSCGPRKKNFMSIDLFEKTIKMLDCEYITIGGGEPTLHPDFWAIVAISLGACDGVWLATNGSQTETTLRLASLAKKGILGCALSQDRYHEAINPRVVKAFSNIDRGYSMSGSDLRKIRNVYGHIVKAGRAARTAVWTQEVGCICPDIFVDPLGSIFSCGCKKLLLGNVVDGWNEVGVKYNARYEDSRWDNIDTGECLFPGFDNDHNKSFLKWLKG